MKRILLISLLIAVCGTAYTAGQPPYPAPAPVPVCIMQPHAFERLTTMVNSQTFDDDKFLVIEAASLGGYFTCGQAATLMSCFQWGDKKLRVLEYVAPHLADIRDIEMIFNQFTFDSEKEQAWRIITGNPNHDRQ